METLLITLLGLATRGREAIGAATLLNAGHTYTQGRREYCPACDEALRQMSGPTVELDADGEEYVCELGPDPSNVWPRRYSSGGTDEQDAEACIAGAECTCNRDPLTGARQFAGELAGVEVTGIRRANDASEGALKHAVALANRAEEMAVAAAVAAFYGDTTEAERCRADVGYLVDMEHDALAEIPVQTSNGADGANLNTEDMLDGCGYHEVVCWVGDDVADESEREGTAYRAKYAGGIARWDHERDAYLSAELPVRERCDAPVKEWERLNTERSLQERGRVEASKRAAVSAAARWKRFKALERRIQRARSAERRCLSWMPGSVQYRYNGECMAEYYARKALGEATRDGAPESLVKALSAKLAKVRKGLETQYPKAWAARHAANMVVENATTWYYGSIGCHGAGDSVSCLFLTKEQLGMLWDANFRSMK